MPSDTMIPYAKEQEHKTSEFQATELSAKLVFYLA